MNKDMTVGNPTRILIGFSIPLLASVVFQQMYNISDSIIAGKFSASGEDALAAIGASYPITMIFMAIAFGINIGCSVVVANLFGSKQYARLKCAVSTTFLATLTLTVVLMGIGLFFGTPLLRLIDTPDDIFSDGALYLRIYVFGLIFLYFYNICNGIFTALGDSLTPLLFLIGSSLGNIGLDFLFVAGFHWDVAGVAWATFLAQGCAAVLSFLTLMTRLKKLRSERFEKFSLPMLGTVSKVALPSILQQSFISVGNLLIQTLVNGFGSATVAGFSAAMKLNTFSTTAITNVSSGISAFTAQNIGAGKPERIGKGWRAAFGISLVVVLVLSVTYTFFPKALMSVFFDDPSGEGAGIGIRFLQIVAPFYIAVAVKIISDGVLRGAGSMNLFMVATFTDLGLRVAIAYLLIRAFHTGSDGIWWSWPVGWILSAGMSLFFYLSGMWKPKRNKPLAAGRETA